MPTIAFDSLPDSARVWVFASERPVIGEAADRLLTEVDEYLTQWRAHGQPLTCSRAWREDRFLAIGVDQTDAFASGCSIDGLFRVLRALQPALGTTLVGGGQVFYRDASRAIRSVQRDEFAALAAAGAITDDTVVFDPTVATAGEWRSRFETEAARAWHRELLVAGK
jgi:hypothetical protein